MTKPNDHISVLQDFINRDDPFWIRGLRSQLLSEVYVESPANSGPVQMVHTPYYLCNEIIGKLREHTELDNKNVLTFNIEFIEGLLRSGANVWFFADNDEKARYVDFFYEPVNIIEKNALTIDKKRITLETDMKFDIIVGNPPYQPNVKVSKGGSGSRKSIWDKFVFTSIERLKDDGYLCMVHPSSWRKPGHPLWDEIRQYSLLYLSINNDQQGLKTFGATTRFDWYTLQKTKTNKTTLIHTEDNCHVTLAIGAWQFLPNYDFKLTKKLLANKKDDTCKIIFTCENHTQNSPHVSESKTSKYRYSCIHWTGKTEPYVKYWYSSKKTDIMRLPKLIFAESRHISNAVVDSKGEYGLTQGVMAIPISSEEHGQQMKKALESERFNEFLKACRWSNFRIDWRMFKYFKKDFWKEFI